MAEGIGRPRTLEEYRALAQKLIGAQYWDYYDGPGTAGQTYGDSIAAFQRYRFRPRVLDDVSVRSIGTTVLGEPISLPIGVAPTALHRFAHPDGEIATAKGTASAGTVFIQSSFSSMSVTKVAEAAPSGVHWMQIYVFRDRRISESLIRRAEEAGFKALVFTVDSPLVGWNVDDFRRAFEHNELHGYGILDLGLPEQMEAKKRGDGHIISYFGSQFGCKVTWEDMNWIKSITSLPVVIKGVLTGLAARQAADAGAAGIIVSAHGGRQMDGVPAPIDALSEVVEAVRGRNVEVYMDGGVRSGSDVLKALARGARAVFIGRPVLWGLTCGGHQGVRNILEILRKELDYAIGLCGCPDVNTIPSDVVVHESYYNTPIHKCKL